MRILMFVPGHKPAYIKKARNLRNRYKELTLVYDLEDSVPRDHKNIAYANVVKVITDKDWVRVTHGTDITKLADKADAIVIPKATPDLMARYTGDYDPLLFVPIIETAEGVEYVREVVASSGAVIFGQYDLAVSMNSDIYSDYASARIVGAAKAHGTPAYNTPHYSLDPNIIAQHARQSYDLGYDGMCVLHPDHIKVVKQHFRPGVNETDWAEVILKDAKDGISVRYNTIIGPPVLERARQVLR